MRTVDARIGIQDLKGQAVDLLREMKDDNHAAPASEEAALRSLDICLPKSFFNSHREFIEARDTSTSNDVVPEFERDNRVIRRAAFFAGMADRVLRSYPSLNATSEFRSDSPSLMAWTYFLLSDAYKPFRNMADSLTDDYKKAALSAIAVMVVRPISPIDPDRVDDLTLYLANPILALACANAWVSNRNLFAFFPPDYLKRFYTSLHATRVPALQPFCDAINSSEDHRQFQSITLSAPEIALIDSWCLKIHMLANMRR